MHQQHHISSTVHIIQVGEDTECIKLLAASKTASKTASMVSNWLREERSMLLVDIYDFFTNTATELRKLYLYFM